MKRWLSIFYVITLVGCGSVKLRDANQAELTAVKKVAIASFSFAQPIAASLLSPGGPDYGTYSSSEVDQTYSDLADTLSSNLKWTVLSAENLRRNPEYQKAYEAKMKGWQANKVPHQGKLFLVPGIMDAQSLFRMKPADRDHLMDGLKVDAIMEVAVQVDFAASAAHVMGFGSRKPKAFINMRMYKRGVEAPIWFDGRLTGDEAKESVGATGYFDETKVTRLGRASAKSAFMKLRF